MGYQISKAQTNSSIAANGYFYICNQFLFQFRRVLSILSLIADEVEFHALEEQYKVNVGGMNVFNYLAFCDDIYAIAKLDKLD